MLNFEQQEFIREQAKAFRREMRAESEREQRIADEDIRIAIIRARRANGEGKVTTRIAASLGCCEGIVVGIVAGLTQKDWSAFWAFFIIGFIAAILLYFVKRDADWFPRILVLALIAFMSFCSFGAVAETINTSTGIIAVIAWIITLILMCFPAFRAFGWIGD